MSKYTTEVRFICESLTGHEMSQGYHNVEDIIAEAAPKIFTENWEIFEDSYRPVLENKIIRHFYFREISEETYALWRMRLDMKMCEIMPYYNQLYKTVGMFADNFWWDTDLTTERHDDNQKNSEYDETAELEKNRHDVRVFGEDVKTDNTETKDTKNVDNKKTDNVNTTETDNKTNTQSNTKTNESSTDNKSNTGRSVSRDFYSDTPQSGIAGVDTDVKDDDGNTENTLDGNMYLTNYRKIKEEHEDDSTDVFNGTNTRDFTGETDFDGNVKAVLDGNVDDTFTGNVKDVLDGNRNTESNTDDNVDTNQHTESVSLGDVKTLDDWIEHMYGKAPHGLTFIELLKKYRESLLNIDMMIIEELNPLFFGLWD